MIGNFVIGFVIGLIIGIAGGAFVALLCAAKGRYREDSVHLIAIPGYVYEGKQLYVIDGGAAYD